eukprot:1719970-Lingulodinium_polyedra.AAC.1
MVADGVVKVALREAQGLEVRRGARGPGHFLQCGWSESMLRPMLRGPRRHGVRGLLVVVVGPTPRRFK